MVPTQKYDSILPLCSQLSAKTQLNASLEQPKQQKFSKSMASSTHNNVALGLCKSD
jgi:hypothetical protein